MNDSEQTAPVKAGETYEVTIDSVGGKGDGVAKIKGFVVFVPNVKKGDNVKIRITKVLPKVGFSEVVGQLDHAPDRPQPRSPRFVTIKPEELNAKKEEEEHYRNYEDTEDFGEDE
jgi:predicted RNA-binding protein with TRAM domain